MSKRTEYDARREGSRLVLRRRQRLVHRITWLLLAVPLGAGSAVGAWHLVGATAGRTMRAAYVVVVFGLVVGIIGMVRGGRR